MRKSYAQEIDGMTVILCNNPRHANLKHFWNEVFEYFEKGYTLYDGDNRKYSPIGMARQRITLVPPSSDSATTYEELQEEVRKIDPIEGIYTTEVETPEEVTTSNDVETPKVVSKPEVKKTVAKKTTAKRTTAAKVKK